MAVATVAVLMAVILLAEVADVERVPRPVRAAQQLGRRELMTRRSVVKLRERCSGLVSGDFSRVRRDSLPSSRRFPIAASQRRCSADVARS